MEYKLGQLQSQLPQLQTGVSELRRSLIRLNNNIFHLQIQRPAQSYSRCLENE